jgi:hypothetical protein
VVCPASPFAAAIMIVLIARRCAQAMHRPLRIDLVDSRCGASKSKSSVERDASNLLLLLASHAPHRSGGSTMSLSHRRLQA